MFGPKERIVYYKMLPFFFWNFPRAWKIYEGKRNINSQNTTYMWFSIHEVTRWNFSTKLSIYQKVSLEKKYHCTTNLPTYPSLLSEFKRFKNYESIITLVMIIIKYSYTWSKIVLEISTRFFCIIIEYYFKIFKHKL